MEVRRSCIDRHQNDMFIRKSLNENALEALEKELRKKVKIMTEIYLCKINLLTFFEGFESEFLTAFLILLRHKISFRFAGSVSKLCR